MGKGAKSRSKRAKKGSKGRNEQILKGNGHLARGREQEARNKKQSK